MDGRKEITSLAEGEDERMRLIRAFDRLERGKNRDIPTATAFLTPREQALLRAVLPDCRFWGGTDGAERAVAYWLPDYLTREDYFSEGVIDCLRGSFYEKNALSHRDVLGALMGAGIRRDAVGDIYVRETCFECFVSADLTRYLLDNMTQAGRHHLRLAAIDPAEVVAPAQTLKPMRLSVASLRLDCVLAAAFHLSRRDTSDVIRTGAAAIDGLPCEKPDRQLAEGETLSLRGKGKLRILAQSGQTKRGRIALTVGLYQ